MFQMLYSFYLNQNKPIYKQSKKSLIQFLIKQLC